MQQIEPQKLDKIEFEDGDKSKNIAPFGTFGP